MSRPLTVEDLTRGLLDLELPKKVYISPIDFQLLWAKVKTKQGPCQVINMSFDTASGQRLWMFQTEILASAKVETGEMSTRKDPKREHVRD